MKHSDSEEAYRSLYLTIYCFVLMFGLVAISMVFYFVRYKKKFYFDAAGRRFIVSEGEHAHTVNKLNEIIQFDNRQHLEDIVNSNFSINKF